MPATVKVQIKCVKNVSTMFQLHILNSYIYRLDEYTNTWKEESGLQICSYCNHSRGNSFDEVQCMYKVFLSMIIN